MGTLKETPVEIIRGRGSHKTEERVFVRRIHENFCVDPKCQFRGRHAVQGVCHTTTTSAGGHDWDYVDRLIALGNSFVDEVKTMAKRGKWSQKKYVAYLESAMACSWSNACSGLDELVRLRRQVSLLTDQVKRLKKRAKK